MITLAYYCKGVTLLQSVHWVSSSSFKYLRRFSTLFYHHSTLSDNMIYDLSKRKAFDTLGFSWSKFCYWHKFQSFHSSSALYKRRKTKEEKQQKNVIHFQPKSKYPVIEMWHGITIRELAEKTAKSIDDVYDAIKLVDCKGTLKPDSQISDKLTLFEVVKTLGYRVLLIRKPEAHEAQNTGRKDQDLHRRPAADPMTLVKRPPVVAIMGHVDHGKTTLLDTLRNTTVAAQEYGGITQHIGAFTVNIACQQITFLDTPGHAAFYAMRQRGANVTDIVILVIAADDSVMEQTVESIRFAREANVPIIVAINKIDRAQSDIEKVKRDLLSCGIQLEEYGGDIQAVCISALKKLNLEQLMEAVLTQAEIMELKSDPSGYVEGVILETEVNSVKGKLSTVLVQRGTLRKGIPIVAGYSWAKIKHLYDEHGRNVQQACPGIAVQASGWKSLPDAGDVILQAESDKHAQDIITYRRHIKEEKKMEVESAIIEEKRIKEREEYHHMRSEKLLIGRFRKGRPYYKEKEITFDATPVLSFVLKGDVYGSIEAIINVLNTYTSHDVCRLDMIQHGVGDVNESDIHMAESFEGLVYCFNITTSDAIKELAENVDVKIKTFNVIYKLFDDIRNEINNRLPKVKKEDVIGEAIVLQEFLINDGKKKVPVAGCRCIKGTLDKKNLFRVMRTDKVLYEGPVISLRHEKSDVRIIKKDSECGVRISDIEVSFLPGDTILCFSMSYVSQETDWSPGF